MTAQMPAPKSAHKITGNSANVCDADLCVLEDCLRDLVRAASDSLSLSVKHLLGDAETGDRLPDCESLATTVETKSRSLLLQSYLTPQQIQQITRAVKCAADLRCVARAAHQTIQLSDLIIAAEAEDVTSLSSVRSVGITAANLARRTAAAFERGEYRAALSAATAYREVDAARARAETELRGAVADVPQSTQRVNRAITWSVAVAAENMARVAARFALPA